MSLAAWGSIGLFVATALFVALRLLRLAGRTRQLPEFAIGAGIAVLMLVGIPLSAAGRIPATVGTSLGNVCFALGIAASCVGIGLLFVFTWSVFRAGQARGNVALGVALAALVAIAVGIVRAAGTQGSLEEILGRTRPWAVSIIVMVMLSFAWTGGESLLCWRNMRRRRALGLGDPVVTNRFLLWGVGGAAGVALCAPNVLFLLQGRALLLEPLALTTMAATGALLSATWYLTFFPPEAYLRRLRTRSDPTPSPNAS